MPRSAQFRFLTVLMMCALLSSSPGKTPRKSICGGQPSASNFCALVTGLRLVAHCREAPPRSIPRRRTKRRALSLNEIGGRRQCRLYPASAGPRYAASGRSFCQRYAGRFISPDIGNTRLHRLGRSGSANDEAVPCRPAPTATPSGLTCRTCCATRYWPSRPCRRRWTNPPHRLRWRGCWCRC